MLNFWPSASIFYIPCSNVVKEGFRVANKLVVGPLAAKDYLGPGKHTVRWFYVMYHQFKIHDKEPMAQLVLL